MSDNEIVVQGLVKQFGKVRAVDDLSFTVRPGRVTGFLGPNGAGKTTTLRMILASLVAGVIFLRIEGFGPALSDPAVTRAMLLNVLAYGIWAVFGVGFGTLIRSQLAAVIIALVLYLIAGQVIAGIIQLIATLSHTDWIARLAVAVPSVASDAMITGGDIPGRPPQWLGAVVLVAYGVVAGTAGTVLTRRRDVG